MHICLQSGSESVLLRMRRMYSAKEFLELAIKLKTNYPTFNLTTDLIAGFPEETEEDFQQTIDMMDKIGFGHVHTFKYSVRKGTRAERMDGQIPEKVKTERGQAIRLKAEASKLEYRKSFIGMTQTVLVETTNKEGYAKGYGEHYVPVLIKQKGLKRNSFYKVQITDIKITDDPVLEGVVLNN